MIFLAWVPKPARAACWTKSDVLKCRSHEDCEENGTCRADGKTCGCLVQTGKCGCVTAVELEEEQANLADEAPPEEVLETLKLLPRELEETYGEEIANQVASFFVLSGDANKDGLITMDEAIAKVKQTISEEIWDEDAKGSPAAECQERKYSKDDVQRIFNQVDYDEDGMMSYMEVARNIHETEQRDGKPELFIIDAKNPKGRPIRPDDNFEEVLDPLLAPP